MKITLLRTTTRSTLSAVTFAVLSLGTVPMHVQAQAINVTASGVGIGTATPGGKFDIAGAGGLVVAAANLDPTASCNLASLANTGKLLVGWNRSAGGGEIDLISNRASGSTGGFAFYDYTNNGTLNQLFQVKGNGSFTIGSTADICRLAVVRNSGTNSEGELFLSDGIQWFKFNSNQSQGAYSPLVQAGDHAFIFTNGSSESGSLVLGQWSASPKGIRIDSTGNVGIGTASAAYKLSVNGVVRSKGFVTDTSNWSDSVFRSDYKLQQLAEVAQYIRDEGHLPGIPSEKEVYQNGVNLGDMQVRLLAKVEELTLHMIEHEKALEALKQQNAELEQENITIKRELQQKLDATP